MKIKFPNIAEPLVLSDEYITTLVIENQNLLYKYVTELEAQSNRQDGDIVLSENDVPLDISKNIELITQYVPFECYKKSLLTKLQTKIKDSASECFYYETQEILATIQQYLYRLTETVNINTELDEIELGSLVKAVNIRFSSDYNALSEAICEYCLNVISLEGRKLFVFLNLNCLITPDDYRLFAQTLIGHKVHALFLENVDREKIECETKTIIDNDLCVI